MSNTAKWIIGLVVVVLAIIGVTQFSGNRGSQEVRVGATLPVTGELSVYAEAIRDGLLLAEYEINQNGGIADKEVNFRILDNENKKSTAQGHVRRFVSNGYPAVINSFEHLTLATKSITEKTDTVMLTHTVYKLSENDQPEFTYRDYWDMGKVGSNFGEAANKINANRTVVIALNDSSHKRFLSSFRSSYKGQIVNIQKYQYGERDFRSLITKVTNSNPDTVVVYGLPVEASVLLQQMKELGVDGINLITGEGTESVVRKRAGEYLQKLNAITYRSAKSSDNSFIDKFKNKYSYDPRPDARYAYEDAKLIADGLRSCAKKNEISGVCLKNYLDKTGKFGDLNNRSRQLPLVQFKDNGSLEKFDLNQ